VSLNVTVVDNQNRYITDVGENEFSVFEDGARQELNFFNRTSLPIAMSLLIDTSASMEQRLAIAQEAAIGFARKLRPQDLAQVVDFDSRVEIVQGFTNKFADLEKAIRATNAGGSTSLHNAIYISLKELAKVKAKSENEIRRQAIVVLSDGEDTSSLVSYEEVLDLAKRSETALYTIGLQPKDAPQGKGFREAEFILRQFAQETGGRAFFPSRAEELKDVYGQIADELSSQYSMGYASKNGKRDGAWRRIVVQVARPNTIARTKRGYFAAAH
jgi:Ca-activated chloride channel family protein